MDTSQAATKRIDAEARLSQQIRECNKKISEEVRAIKKLNKEIVTLDKQILACDKKISEYTKAIEDLNKEIAASSIRATESQ